MQKFLQKIYLISAGKLQAKRKINDPYKIITAKKNIKSKLEIAKANTIDA